MKDVASVSAPANALSESKTASSTPIEITSLSACSACGGPIEMAVILPPIFSFILMASSTAYISRGLTIDGTPSLISVLVSGSILTF